MNWFLPSCRQLRAQVNEAREIITREIEKREKLEEGTTFDDAIEWSLQAAKATGKNCDPTMVQLILSFLAIHTTTDLLTQTLVELAQHPEVMNDLREEISDNIGPDGLTKTSLQGMKLLDSVIKESQRTKPTGISEYHFQDALNFILLTLAQSRCNAWLPKTSRFRTAHSSPETVGWRSQLSRCGTPKFMRNHKRGTHIVFIGCVTTLPRNTRLSSSARLHATWVSILPGQRPYSGLKSCAASPGALSHLTNGVKRVWSRYPRMSWPIHGCQ